MLEKQAWWFADRKLCLTLSSWDGAEIQGSRRLWGRAWMHYEMDSSWTSYTPSYDYFLLLVFSNIQLVGSFLEVVGLRFHFLASFQPGTPLTPTNCLWVLVTCPLHLSNPEPLLINPPLWFPLLWLVVEKSLLLRKHVISWGLSGQSPYWWTQTQLISNLNYMCIIPFAMWSNHVLFPHVHCPGDYDKFWSHFRFSSIGPDPVRLSVNYY